MSTYTTSAVIQGGSSPKLNAMIAEICNALVTECGLTQTSDTGQVWSAGGGATATWSTGTNTSYGYVILRFNDTLQSTCPIFIRLDFGNGAADTQSFFWITVGTSSNGSGTIGGTAMTKVGCVGTTGPGISTYTSYFVYNATYGVLGMAYKVGGADGGAAGVPALSYGGFYLFRGSTSTGAANSDAACLLSMLSANGSPFGTGPSGIQTIGYGTTTVYPTTLLNGIVCAVPPVGGYEGAIGGAAPTIWPLMYLSPAPTISGIGGYVNCSDVAVGTTFTSAILGATALTFLNAGGALGCEYLGNPSAAGTSESYINGFGTSNTASTANGLAFLWE